MNKLVHDTLVDLHLGTPVPFTLAAFSLPALLSLQFLLAGQALFAGSSWDMHSAFGGAVAILVVTLISYSLAVTRLRGFAWWALVIGLLYALQLVLASSGPDALAFHPFNGALLLAASLVFLLQVARRRAVQTNGD